MNERTFDDFDEFANSYRDIHSANIKLSGADSLYFAEHKVLELKNFEKDEYQQMLDVGCGDGAVEIFIHQNFPSWLTQAIDISDKSVREAKERHIPNASFTLYDGKTIPFNDNSFDLVFVAAVFHHIDFKLHSVFLNEIYRVLKIGGRVYIFEHNPLNPVTRYLVKTCVFDKSARLLSYTYAKKMLKTAGFNPIQKKFTIFFPRKGILSSLLKLEKKLSWCPFGGQYYFRAVK